MTTLHASIKAYTDRLTQQGLLRARKLSMPERSDLLCFDSNDYLSLTQEPRISEYYQEGFKSNPCGSGGSMLLNGYHATHHAVERAFAQWLHVDECLLFISGYAANLAVTGLLGQLKAHCFIDKGVHASIYDGLTLSQTPYVRYRHNNMDDLAAKLSLGSQSAALITEGIFSMSGQIAPLANIATLCSKNEVAFLVDEAHSLGIIGHEGRGAIAHHGLSQREVPLRVIPLGKAFAGQGAVVAGQSSWINALLQAGRSLTYSTAISPALSYGLLKTLDVVAAADDRRLKLMELIAHFRACIKDSPLIWTDSTTPIQQLQLGCPHKALAYVTELQKQGISCSAIRKPTVSTKASGLRVLLNYQHKPEQINQLFHRLHSIYEHS
ncbi:MAG: aminotransferase class I/II-fold pyridoxal phosphate-dependent enzyme [Legionellales bacterium]